MSPGKRVLLAEAPPFRNLSLAGPTLARTALSPAGTAVPRSRCPFDLGWRHALPRFSDQRCKLALRDLREIDDDIGALAPHEFHKRLGVRIEQEFLSFLREVQVEPIGANHREDPLLGTKARPAEMIDFTHAFEGEGHLPYVLRRVHPWTLLR